MADEPSYNADQTQLLDITESGKAVSQRIGSAQQAQEICNRLIRDDIIRAGRRLQVQGQYNGNSPKSIQAMKRAGREGDSNLNWKQNRAQVINAWTPFFDIICEVPVCIDGELEISDPQTDADLMRGIAEYFHAMIFGWDGFDEMNQLRDLQMLLHGHGILVWPDEWTWYPEPILANNFYLPDETLSSLKNGEIVMVTKNFTAGELYRNIADPKAATARGWDIEAVQGTIMNAASAAAIQAYGKIWDRWEQAFKNGDLYITNTQTKQIPLAKIFVQEMDGSISEMLIEQSPGGTSANTAAFLYRSKPGDGIQGKYKCWSECVCLFPYDIGADGTFHSTKGMGTDIFPYCELLNKVFNTLADLVVTGVKPMWQPLTGGDIEKFQMVKFGNGNLIPQGFAQIDSKIGANLNPALEISREFTQALNYATGSYAPQDISAPTVEETAKAASIRAAERAKLTKGAYNRFMRGVDKEYAEMFRRASNPELKDHHPNALPALKFQAKCRRLCENMGVPWEVTIQEKDALFSPTGKAGTFTVLQMVQNVRATRSLGMGSPAMRMEIAGQLMQNIDRFDEIGQNEIKRFFVAAMTSYHTVDAIVPSLSNQRNNVNEQSVAANEDNGFTALGPDAEAFVVPGQNHIVHLSVHVPSMQNDMQLCQQGQQDPRECAKRLEGKAPHTMQHLAALKANPTKQRDYQQFHAAIAQIASFQDHLQQMIEEQNQAMAEQQQQNPQQPTPEEMKVQADIQLKAQKQQATLTLKAQNQKFNQNLKADEAVFHRRLSDLTTAGEEHRKNMQTANDVLSTQTP